MSVDVDLDFVGGPLDIDLVHLPKIQLGIDPLTINVSKIQLGIDPLTVNPITINPLDLTVRLKEFPSIRVHVPANYGLGLSILGFQLMAIRLCGEAQIITEPYRPNECERCDQRERALPVDVPK